MPVEVKVQPQLYNDQITFTLCLDDVCLRSEFRDIKQRI